MISYLRSSCHDPPLGLCLIDELEQLPYRSQFRTTWKLEGEELAA